MLPPLPAPWPTGETFECERLSLPLLVRARNGPGPFFPSPRLFATTPTRKPQSVFFFQPRDRRPPFFLLLMRFFCLRLSSLVFPLPEKLFFPTVPAVRLPSPKPKRGPFTGLSVKPHSPHIMPFLDSWTLSSRRFPRSGFNRRFPRGSDIPSPSCKPILSTTSFLLLPTHETILFSALFKLHFSHVPPPSRPLSTISRRVYF